MMHDRFHTFLKRHRRQRGSALIAVTAVGVLLFLLMVSFSISELRITRASQGLTNELAEQLQMIAESGLQEAIATRLYPAGNRLAWGFNTAAEAETGGNPITRPKPFFFESSYVYNNDELGNERLLGRYQYIVLGANPFLSWNGTNFVPTEALLDEGAFLYNIEHPVYVMSRGVACIDPATNEIAHDSVLAAGYDFACAGNALPRSRTILATLQPVANAANPNANAFEVSSVRSVADAEAIPVEAPFLNRDGNAISSINFLDWWNNAGVHASANGMAVPVALQYAQDTAGADYYTRNTFFNLWPGGTTTINLGNDKHMPYLDIIFRGDVDERSLYTGNGHFVYQGLVDMLNTAPNGLPGVAGNYSAVALTEGGTLSEGAVQMRVSYPGASHLRIQGTSPCGGADALVLNPFGLLRDSMGFANPQAYTVRFEKPCPPDAPDWHGYG